MPFPNQATQFKRGGPPGPGRPRTARIMELWRDALVKLDKKGLTLAERIQRRWQELILEGNVPLLLELVRRIEGNEPIKVELEGQIETHDAELPAILAALGIGPDPEERAKMDPGFELPGRAGRGRKPRKAHKSAASQAARSKAAGVHGKGRGKAKPAADRTQAAKTRKKRKGQ